MHINERDVKILLMVAKGMSASKIAEVFGAGHTTIGNRLIQLNNELGGDLILSNGSNKPRTLNPSRVLDAMPIILNLGSLFKELRGSKKTEIELKDEADILRNMPSKRCIGAEKLTLLQQTALYLVGEGYSTKMIAEAMGQGVAASGDQVRRACGKLGARDRSQGAVMLRALHA